MDDKTFDVRVIGGYLIVGEWVKDLDNEKLKLVAQVTEHRTGETINWEFESIETYKEFVKECEEAEKDYQLKKSGKE